MMSTRLDGCQTLRVELCVNITVQLYKLKRNVQLFLHTCLNKSFCINVQVIRDGARERRGVFNIQAARNRNQPGLNTHSADLRVADSHYRKSVDSRQQPYLRGSVWTEPNADEDDDAPCEAEVVLNDSPEEKPLNLCKRAAKQSDVQERHYTLPVTRSVSPMTSYADDRSIRTISSSPSSTARLWAFSHSPQECLVGRVGNSSSIDAVSAPGSDDEDSYMRSRNKYSPTQAEHRTVLLHQPTKFQAPIVEHLSQYRQQQQQQPLQTQVRSGVKRRLDEFDDVEDLRENTRERFVGDLLLNSASSVFNNMRSDFTYASTQMISAAATAAVAAGRAVHWVADQSPSSSQMYTSPKSSRQSGGAGFSSTRSSPQDQPHHKQHPSPSADGAGYRRHLAAQQWVQQLEEKDDIKVYRQIIEQVYYLHTV